MFLLNVISGLHTGGAETAMLRVSSGLVAKGHRVAVLSLRRHSTLESAFRDQNITVYYLADIFRDFSIIKSISSPDVMMAWMAHANAASVLLKYLLSAKKVVWNIRQSLSPWTQVSPINKLFILLNARLSGIADMIIYNSNKGKEDHEAYGYNSKKSLVIPNGFKVYDYPRSFTKPDLSVLFVGRDHPDKGFDVFFKAVTFALSAKKNIQVLAVGRGLTMGSRWESSVPESFKSSFKFYGELPQEQLYDLYRTADVYVSSSKIEAFSNTIGEAMGHGCIPIVSNVGDSAKIAGDSGFVVNSGDHIEIAKRILKILELSIDEKKSLSQASRLHIAHEYSIGKIIETYEKELVVVINN